jgi:uncharacterized protein YndB with AHSA1/START domain
MGNGKLRSLMTPQTLSIKAALKISASPHDVFEAIADPVQMKNYFISESTGRIEGGAKLVWKFPELDMEFPVRIDKVEKDKFISFFWSDFDGTETRVEMTLTLKEDHSTFVQIIEKSRNNDEAGIKWLQGNTEGWANFLACLKAWVEYGINLRNNAFDISQMPEQK